MLIRYADIGKRLREIREDEYKIKSKNNMAEIFNITVEYYDAMERGKYLPNIEMLSEMSKNKTDIDYLLTGKKIRQSVFSEVFLNLNDNEKSEVSKLLLYKLRLLKEGNSKEEILETRIRTYKNKEISSYDRIRDIIEIENNCKKMNACEIAEEMGVSERKVNRLNKNQSYLKTEEIMNIFYKYKYYPSYILCGEINSNSKIDQAYIMLEKSEKDTIMSCAKKLAAYCGAGKQND
ncbi:MAG: helix-turn-helix transcriptional regulator [Lachnospiraceae bacterium]|nr:helix-turn-helix transcriptional regulator [Lachnospiraceae bacterium]